MFVMLGALKIYSPFDSCFFYSYLNGYETVQENKMFSIKPLNLRIFLAFTSLCLQYWIHCKLLKYRAYDLMYWVASGQLYNKTVVC